MLESVPVFEGSANFGWRAYTNAGCKLGGRDADRSTL